MKIKKSLQTDLSEPQTLYTSRKKWIFISCCLIFMAIIPFCALVFGDVKPNEKWGIVIGLILVIGLAILSFFVSSPKATYFKLSKNGFEQSFCYIKKSFLWKDITEFGIHIILNGKPIIGFNVRKDYIDNSMYMKTTNGKIFDKMFDYKYQISENYGNDSYVFLNYLNEMLLKYKN